MIQASFHRSNANVHVVNILWLKYHYYQNQCISWPQGCGSLTLQSTEFPGCTTTFTHFISCNLSLQCWSKSWAAFQTKFKTDPSFYRLSGSIPSYSPHPPLPTHTHTHTYLRIILPLLNLLLFSLQGHSQCNQGRIGCCERGVQEASNWLQNERVQEGV